MDPNSSNRSVNERTVIDIALKLVLVFFLVAWCAMIILPFVTVLLWSAILAITLYPLYFKMTGWFRNNRIVTAVTLSLVLLLIVLVPAAMLIGSMYEETKELRNSFRSETLVIPPPNAKVAEWPVIGPKLFDAWKALNQNLESAIIQYKDQLLAIGRKVITSLMSFVSTILMFTASIIIAGVMLATSEKSEKSSLQLSTRLAGGMGAELTSVIIQTVRNVAKGIIGVAFIQFVLMGSAFLFAGVPLAGIWALLVLMLALIQLPTILVALPVIIYLYSAKDPLPATLWSAVILLAGLSDNILKPLLMGKGAPVPMLVIFLGAIGGFIFSGFLGMFTGAIVLSVGYKLGGMWLTGEIKK